MPGVDHHSSAGLHAETITLLPKTTKNMHIIAFFHCAHINPQAQTFTLKEHWRKSSLAAMTQAWSQRSEYINAKASVFLGMFIPSCWLMRSHSWAPQQAVVYCLVLVFFFVFCCCCCIKLDSLEGNWQPSSGYRLFFCHVVFVLVFSVASRHLISYFSSLRLIQNLPAVGTIVLHTFL